MRLIDADAFDKVLSDAQSECKRNGGNFRVGVLSNVRENLAKAPTAVGWISVKDRLPENKQWALCKCRAGIYEVLRNDFGSWYHDKGHTYMSGFVTHWMPLPEPPEE